MKTRKYHLDYLKAIAVFLVVVHHCLAQAFGAESCPPAADLIINLIYSVHVPLFLLIAGYLSHSQEYGSYIKKKAKRILVPFAFFSLLKIFFSIFVSGEYSHSGSLTGLFSDAFIYGNTYWFAYTVFLMFAAVPYLWHAKKSGNCLIMTVPILVLSFVAGALLEHSDRNSAINLFQIRNYIINLPYFITGYLIQVYEESLGLFFKLHRRCITLLASGAVICISVLLYTYTIVFSVTVKYLLSFPLMVLIYSAVRLIPGDVSLLTDFSSYSLQVMFFDSVFRVIFFKVFSALTGAGFITAILTVPAVIFCSYLSCKVCERFAFSSFLTGLNYKRVPENNES